MRTISCARARDILQNSRPLNLRNRPADFSAPLFRARKAFRATIYFGAREKIFPSPNPFPQCAATAKKNPATSRYFAQCARLANTLFKRRKKTKKTPLNFSRIAYRKARKNIKKRRRKTPQNAICRNITNPAKTLLSFCGIRNIFQGARTGDCRGKPRGIRKREKTARSLCSGRTGVEIPPRAPSS